MNENYENTNNAIDESAAISADLNYGLHSALYRRIGEIRIADPTISSAFDTFIRSAEVGDSFSIGDILFGGESVTKGYEPDVSAGNGVYLVSRLGLGRNSLKLYYNSVGGIYALVGLNNGVSVDIAASGGSFAAAEAKRFAILSDRKAAKIIPAAAAEGAEVTRVGEMIASPKLIVRRGLDVAAVIDKTYSCPSERESVTLDRAHLKDFIAGYVAVCSYYSCRCVADNNLVRFGLGGNTAGICARALGFFAAANHLKAYPVDMVFTPDEGCSVSVRRPSVVAGDQVCLLKVRNEGNGLPDRLHHRQLNYYLSEMSKRGIIKNVLPVKENILSVIRRLCGDRLDFTVQGEIPSDCFGVIVIVGEGRTVNGIKIGYFSEIEEDPRSPQE